VGAGDLLKEKEVYRNISAASVRGRFAYVNSMRTNVCSRLCYAHFYYCRERGKPGGKPVSQKGVIV
jgi:hypothetical protein